MVNMISALRYPGGKARNIKKLMAQHFPPMNQFSEFREPLCGGLSVSLYFKEKHPELSFAASDLNYELFCFWQTLKNYPNELITTINFLKDEIINGKEYFYKILNRRKENLSVFQRAVDFYIINKISFSGLADSGGYSNEAFEKRFTKSSINNLTNIAKMIKGFQFYCVDYLFLFEKPGENIFIYADPPYFKQKNSKLYGVNGDLHIGFDHERFFECFKKCNHKCLISYDDSDFIRSLYKSYNMKEIQLSYSMNNVNSKTCKKGNELIITNF